MILNPVTKLIINNQETPCISGKQITLVDPSNGGEWLKVDEADKEDAEVAVKHAEAAWPAWSAQPAHARAAVLRKYAGLIAENAKGLAELEAKTIGKLVVPFIPGFDIMICIAILNYFAALVETDHCTVSTNTPGFLNYTLHPPYGVTAGIIPWNGPTYMFLVKVAGAVGAGNAIIIKSSEKAPVTPLILGKLAVEAGFPPGLIQVLSGYGPTCGAALAMHMKIRKISFTGSLAVGKLIQQMAGQSNLKFVTLELGGKSPAIIFPDADISAAAQACAFSIMMNSGQACMASSRVYVHSSIKCQFLKAYQAAIKAQAQKIGGALDPSTTHGPQVDKIQFEKIKKYLDIGKSEGNVVVGGSAIDREGFFIQPTIFEDVADTATISREEIFGPVAIVNSFETEEEVIKRANDTEYGLYASVFTKNIDRAMRISSALESGCVGINCTSPTMTVDLPFGGYKQSGLGRELGPNSLRIWQEVKSVFLKIDPAAQVC